MMGDLYVTKRNLEKERLQRSKILERVRALTSGLDLRYIDVDGVVDAVLSGSFDGITTVKLDELCAQTAAYSATRHPDYAILAGRLAVTALHKTTPATFFETVKILYEHRNKKTNEPAPLVSQEVYDVVMKNSECLEKAIRHDLDMNYEYFGLKTLERSYLLRVDNGKELVVVERPQYILMRVSIGIHQYDIPAVLETYSLLAQGAFTHASPTLFNSGTPTPQMSSCFLVAMKEDSIQGIYDTLKTCAMISKCAGGIGVHMHCIRSSGSYIRGTNGTSNGLVPLLRVYNDTARYVDQGGGKRKGAFAVYLEPWHADIFDFLQLKKNTGKEEMRARDLFYGLWIPDLFMKRVQANGTWTLFDPNSSPGLADAWGDDFEALYTRYEKEGTGVRTIEAQQLWFHIIESQIETGTPYMLFKDSCNRKSNQKNLGTIKCSNLCTEIIEYTAPDEVAVCNLASISLPSCVVETGSVKTFDHEKLKYITMVTTRNLNKVIERNYYPVEEAKRSNFRHRPIGIGVQGLADAFLLLGLSFTCPEAQQMNEDIFETIYYAALKASCEIAQKEGTYETYPGSPISQGLLQFDMWNVKPKSGRWPWDDLRKEISQYGVRNSLLVAPMPTASTSQILGNNECFEPFTSNIYLRRVLSGEFPIVNKYLVRDLVKLGLWTENIRNNIIAHNGSINFVDEIPPEIKTLYRTVWEIKQKDLIDMAAARGAYIDQSQSLNLFLETPTSAQVTSMHFYTWKKGLKTGMYYLRSRPAADAIKFTVDQTQVQGDQKGQQINLQEAQEGCVSCGS